MAALRRYRAAEQELMEALSAVVRKEGSPGQPDNCPSIADLRRFVAGKYESTQSSDEMLAHLGRCDRCIAFLTKMRAQRISIKRTSLVLGAAAVLVIAVWAGLQRSAPASQVVATVDLRTIAPTRGTGRGDGAVVAKIPRDTARLRIILPVGSEGSYDFELLSSDGGQSLYGGSAQTNLENHDVVLTLPVNLRRLNPGRYSLALRRSGFDREYYPLILE